MYERIDQSERQLVLEGTDEISLGYIAARTFATNAGLSRRERKIMYSAAQPLKLALRYSDVIVNVKLRPPEATYALSAIVWYLGSGRYQDGVDTLDPELSEASELIVRQLEIIPANSTTS
jgi:hypothetical protein